MNNNFFVLIFIMLFFAKGYNQIAEGPAQGSAAGGATVSTDSFPDITSNVSSADQPETNTGAISRGPLRITRRPSPTNYAPLVKEGSNYMEDPSLKQKRNSVSQNLIVGPDYPISFQGMLDNNKEAAPDPYIAVGPDHVMTVVNTRFRISEKSGNTLQTIDAKSWFLSVYPDLVFIYDPKVHYDHFANRWIMVWLGDTNFATEVSYYLVSISDDDNPLGTWHNWAIPADVNGNQKVSNWVDYEGVGYDDQAFYFVSDQIKFPSENYAYDYTKIRILAKKQFYRNDADSVSWTDFWAIKDLNGKLIEEGSRPAINYNISDSYYIAARPNIEPADFFVMYKITNPLNEPEISAVHIPVTPWYTAPNAQQLGGGTSFENFPMLPNEVVYRDSSLWLVHSVASGTVKQFSSIRYLRFNLNTNTAMEDVAFGAENCWYFYPALTVDQNKNVAITFCRSANTEYAGAYFTWRLNTDPPGLRPSITIKEGQAHFQWLDDLERNRFGDYSGIALDPVDPNLFWMYTEYTEFPENNWGTWIYATPLQSLPAIAEIFTSNTYFRPALDSVIIQVATTNPVGLQVTAEVVPEHSIIFIPLKLFDDGLHADGAANDSLFGNVWPVSAEEQNYSIDITASQVTSDTIHIKNIARFTTIGPVQLANQPYKLGSYFLRTQSLFLILQNNGKKTAAKNVTTRLNSTDPRIYNLRDYGTRFDEINPGSIDTSNASFSFDFVEGYNPDSTINNPIPFTVTIQSNGNPYWTDSFEWEKDTSPGTAIADDITDIPDKFVLSQNYPNPFNPRTMISYQLPMTSEVELSIFNLLGQKVATLVDKKQTAGNYSVEWDASSFTSGIYIYTLETSSGFKQSRKLVLLK